MSLWQLWIHPRIGNHTVACRNVLCQYFGVIFIILRAFGLARRNFDYSV
ncbi:hypothetical protein EMIT0P176_170046 [Pseudomonas sp. IT-P176]